MHPGKTIRARRKAQGWSVETLADRAKLSPRQLYRVEALETRSPGLEFLEKIAGALDSTLAELFIDADGESVTLVS